MLWRLVREEAGMTMGLAVVTMVLVGVMGAGLLVFVNTDLGQVIETNQGQKALEMADAGVQAAKLQLMTDSTANHYNGGSGDIQWSKDFGGAGNGGVTLTKGTDSAKVTIKALSPAVAGGNATAGTGSGTADAAFDCDGDGTADDVAAGDKPVITTGITDVNASTSFRVISDGKVGNARRVVEAILTKAGGASTFPMANYSTQQITVSDSTKMRCISVFAGDGLTTTNAVRDVPPADQDTPSLDGPDVYYGNWYNPPWNNVARPIRTGLQAGGYGVNGVYTTEAGFGVEKINSGSGYGNIPYTSKGAGTTDEQIRLVTGRVDYNNPGDSSFRASANVSSTGYTANSGLGLRFVRNTWAQTNPDATTNTPVGSCPSGPTTPGPNCIQTISYPFDPRISSLSNATPDETSDETLMVALKAEAQAQNKYLTPGGDFEFNTLNYTMLNDPEDVVYIRMSADDKKVIFKNSPTVAGCSSTGILRCPQGTLVIERGKFESDSNLGFEGVIIMRGLSASTPNPRFAPNTSFSMTGFINVEGSMELKSETEVVSISPDDLGKYAAFSLSASGNNSVPLQLVSWRECYNATCT